VGSVSHKRGVLGVRGKLFALPPTTLSVDAYGDFTTVVNRQNFHAAPEIALDIRQESTGPSLLTVSTRWTTRSKYHLRVLTSRTNYPNRAKNETKRNHINLTQ